MKHARKTALAASAFTCAALLSFGWSEQGGISLSIESAQARVGRPLTPVSVAGVARRQDRRAAYGYGYGYSSNNPGGLVGGADSGTYSSRRWVGTGYGVAGAAAVGTAAAVAATSPNWGWGGGPYYGGRAWGAQASYTGPGY